MRLLQGAVDLLIFHTKSLQTLVTYQLGEHLRHTKTVPSGTPRCPSVSSYVTILINNYQNVARMLFGIISERTPRTQLLQREAKPLAKSGFQEVKADPDIYAYKHILSVLSRRCKHHVNAFKIPVWGILVARECCPTPKTPTC